MTSDKNIIAADIHRFRFTKYENYYDNTSSFTEWVFIGTESDAQREYEQLTRENNSPFVTIDFTRID